MMTNHTSYSTLLAAVAVVSIWMTGGAAQAGVSPEEAKQLGTTLTPIGAEVAASKDGVIPAWDVNKTMRDPPAHYKPKDPRGGGPYVYEYPDEKPLFSITKENMAKYVDKLDAGAVYLLKNREGYRMDVYPTHRNIGLPDWVYENTKKCAVSAKLEGGGLGFSGAHACVPFPIPKNGYEAIWNAKNYPRVPYVNSYLSAYLFDSNGKSTMLSSSFLKNAYPFWDNSLKETKWSSLSNNTTTGPASKAGERILQLNAARGDLDEDLTYNYTPGLRRVRLSPETKYDTVLTSYGGIYLVDELNGFQGKMDRFDFKLVGKKEMYIQYNSTGFLQTTPEELADPHGYPKPKYVRWELHRVWEVEATLKPGMRHSQSKKVFYLDEDSWLFSNYVAFDGAGNLVKIIYQNAGSQGAERFVTNSIMIFDVTRGYWAVPTNFSATQGHVPTSAFPAITFNVDAFASQGVR